MNGYSPRPTLAAFALAAALVMGATTALAQVFPGRSWESVDPAAAGWSAQGLQKAQAQFSQMGSSALVVVHDGRIVAAWGDVTRPIKIHSARKSLMSALYGVAVAQGRVDLGATMQDLKIDDLAPALTAQEKAARVRDLLMARSGVYHDAAAETKRMKELRPQRGSHAPGTFWYYNNWDFNVAGAILRTATGEDTFKAMEQHIARPIGMEEFTAANGEYVTVRASQYPAYHMKLSARDLARFGWLFLNKGRWGDQQVIPASWVAESTRAWTPEARKGIAYGYMWWVSQGSLQYQAEVGPGSFSARGNGGQILVVAPARGLVVAHLNDQEENEKLERGEFDKLLQLIVAAAPPMPSASPQPSSVQAAPPASTASPKPASGAAAQPAPRPSASQGGAPSDSNVYTPPPPTVIPPDPARRRGGSQPPASPPPPYAPSPQTTAAPPAAAPARPPQPGGARQGPFPHQQPQGANPAGTPAAPTTALPPYSPSPPQPGAAPPPGAASRPAADAEREQRALREQCRNGDTDACARLGAMISRQKEGR